MSLVISRASMHLFELRPVNSGFELSGGYLPTPMAFGDFEMLPVLRLVGYLSQHDVSELLIFNAEGDIIETRLLP
jgi:hypothetical protein